MKMKMSFASAVLTGFVAVFAATGSAQVPPSAVALNSSAALSAATLAPSVPTFVPLSLKEGPDPSTAWVFAAGFLALVVLRRLGSASQM
jgi:hypothetical protein